MLHIHLFGNPQILYNGEPLPLPTPNKVFVLWVHLLLNRQHPISRDQLAYTLWADVSEAEARTNLRRHLHLLRKQLPPAPDEQPWILTTRSTLQWNPAADYWLDVALLEKFDTNAAGEKVWRELVQCYRGELLEGLYDDELLAERTRLHLRYIRLLQERVKQKKAEGDFRTAIDAAQRLLLHDPLREELYRLLIELYYCAGDRAAALREFEKCQAVLQDELGIDPMPETLALRDAILQGEGRLLAERHDDSRSRLKRDLPEQSSQSEQNDLPAQPPPTPAKHPTAPHSVLYRYPRRWWLLGGAFVMLALLLLGLLINAATSSQADSKPISTAVSGSAYVRDTWITCENPDLLYDPDFPGDLYVDYAQVHLSFFAYPYDRMLIYFDLTHLPRDAQVQRAVLHLHLESFINEDLRGPLPATVSAFCVLVPWQADTVTFNFPWSQPGMAAGLDYTPQAVGSQYVYDTGWVSLDITPLVGEWLAQPDENYGLMLMITEAPQGAHYWADTTDYPMTSRQPRIELIWTP